MTTTESIPYLSEKVLEDLGITTADTIAAIEALIRGSAENKVWSAPKAVIMPPDGRYMMAALAAMDDPSLLAVKTVVLNPRNPERGLAQINGLVTMLDSETGLPAAIVDGNWITAVRTAGLSATAAKHMAREDCKTLAFVGSGVQARSHLTAFSEMFSLKKIKVFGRGQANIERLCGMAEELGMASEVCGSGKEVVSGADLLVTSVTYSPDLEPFLDAEWMEPGSFAAVTDLAAPWDKQSFAAFDVIAIDDTVQEAALPNKLVPPEYVTGDLAGLVLGKFQGRRNDAERTAFIYRGHALGDLALASLAYRKHREQATG
jgi:ornithine cyclodeaminase/alanine dehydrogenase